jgi:hypothetical protein
VLSNEGYGSGKSLALERRYHNDKTRQEKKKQYSLPTLVHRRHPSEALSKIKRAK